VKSKFNADVFLKTFDPSKWKEVIREDHQVDEKHAYPYSFVTLIKK
jgi:dihydrofolate reductase